MSRTVRALSVSLALGPVVGLALAGTASRAFAATGEMMLEGRSTQAIGAHSALHRHYSQEGGAARSGR